MILKNSFWRQCFRVCVILIALYSSAFAQASADFDVGLVNSQFSAEIVAAGSLTATEPDGTKTLIEKGKYFVSVNQDGKISLADQQLSSGTVLAYAESEDKDSEVTGGDRGHKYFTVNRQDYRGVLKLYVTGEGKSLTIVNQVPLEYYVNSVLGPKSSPIWPDEAIKAQAIAVRSLAWYYTQYPESELFSVRAVNPETFYGGIRNENKNITEVAAKTAGQVLYYNGKPAMTYSCESSGGMTVGSLEALGKAIPYLQPVEDYDGDCPNATWEKRIPVATISRILEQNGHKIGRLRSYRLSDSSKPSTRDRHPSGRVKLIYWQGETGGVTMDGKEFADMLALSSTCFDAFIVDPVPDKLDVPIENGYGIEIGKKEIPIEIKGREKSSWQSAIPGFHFLNGTKDETVLFKGKGIGSGIGLSKWGAKGMADNAPEQSADYYKTILQHYYPGTYLVSVY